MTHEPETIDGSDDQLVAFIRIGNTMQSSADF